ncbi:OmpH family outer membrane protein [Histidinibacterium aquaticum]|uniref:OmpH family outer membrane protein n=1 Tax=Histidinibacterium aquaticum TaxID=2613962 RepID=A0A5J5GM55_9RHOB|nr:OmpH family outer membrane protein [Histidinibacterium aquaticum]KAA9008733.1 OmpH family outer membrane protein [Histidinibacterium aquaticum]
MPARRAGGLCAALLALLLPGTLPAQQQGNVAEQFPVQGPEVVRSPVLTIDPDRVFSESRFGQHITEEIQAETEALAEENRRIAARLEAEERDLTERRPDIPPEEFRAEAEEFDARVQEIRREQDAKERAIGERVQQAQAAFLGAVRPVLANLMIERGAAVILDRRTVVLGAGAVDITDAAIERIDAEMGEGPGVQALDDLAPAPEIDTVPDPEAELESLPDADPIIE